MSPRARSQLMPGFRRPTTSKKWFPRCAHAFASKPIGVNNCVSPRGKENPAGITPMTVYFSSFSDTVRPTAAGSDAKRRTHKPWVRTTVFGAPDRSSSVLKTRPIAGFTSRTANRFGVTCADSMSSGSPAPVSETAPFRIAAMSSKTWFWRFPIHKFAGAGVFCGKPTVLASSHTAARRSEPGNGSGRNRTEFTTVKIAVLAPMPTPAPTELRLQSPGSFEVRGRHSEGHAPEWP